MFGVIKIVDERIPNEGIAFFFEGELGNNV